MKALKYLKYLNRKDLQVGHTYIIDGEYLYYDAVIAELEALQQPKSCEGCKYGISYVGTDRKYCEAKITQDGMITVEYTFCCNRYEPKGAMR